MARNRAKMREGPLAELFRATEAAQRGASAEEPPAVEPDPTRDVLHIGTHRFAEIGDLVDKGDFGRKERVRRVLDQLGCLDRGEYDRRLE